jgi:hypothetical protein
MIIGEIKTLGLSTQLAKCGIWSPHGLNSSILFLLGFLTVDTSFHILCAPMGFYAILWNPLLKRHFKKISTP